MSMSCCLNLGNVAIAILAVKLAFLLKRWLYPYVIAKMLGKVANLRKHGEWAVVTGATDGIGRGYANALAKQGFKIFLLSRSEEKLQNVAKEIGEKYNTEVRYLPIDFASSDVFGSKYAKVEEEMKNLDTGVLVNNVGLSYDHPEYYHQLLDESESECIVRKLVNVNLLSTTVMTRFVLPGMVTRKTGVVINVASAGAILPMCFTTLYGAAKAGVMHFTKCLRVEYSDMPNLQFQCVYPYFVATKMSKIRRPSFFCPGPDQFAKEALGTVGLVAETPGCFAHALQDTVVQLLPTCLIEFLTRRQMVALRKAALKKKAAKKD